jgi:hypothetical protein
MPNDRDVSKQQRLCVKSWWQRHRILLGLVVALYVVLLFGLRWAGVLSGQWTNATTAYFVVANLIVLWWYADTTQRLAEMAEGQLQFQVSQWRVLNKPIVFFDANVAITPNGGRGIRYVAHNVGTGLAINVYEVQLRDGRWSSASIGAIEPGGKRHLSGSIEDPLRDHGGTMPHRILITEAVRSRTNQWMVTLNALDRNGGVRHVWVADFDPKKEMTLAELLVEHGPRFQRELIALHQEVARS